MNIETGASAWRSTANHNRMIDLQARGDGATGAEGGDAQNSVQLTFFGGSAFRITSPLGVSIMIDPWRNLPTRNWDWYFHDFPAIEVDIGVSTHAHFDHDALHRLDASVLLDRLIGTYTFADVNITGLADKHATDSSHGTYDFRRIYEYFGAPELDPPDNARSWDNCLIVVETGDLRILHWGDNRHDPPPEIWDALGRIDILLVPVDDSQHVLSHEMVDEVVERVAPTVVVPHHYYIWNVVQRQSTLFPIEQWLADQPRVRRLGSAETRYARASLPDDRTVDSFGEHVAFDVDDWHRANGSTINVNGGLGLD